MKQPSKPTPTRAATNNHQPQHREHPSSSKSEPHDPKRRASERRIRAPIDGVNSLSLGGRGLNGLGVAHARGTHAPQWDAHTPREHTFGMSLSGEAFVVGVPLGDLLVRWVCGSEPNWAGLVGF